MLVQMYQTMSACYIIESQPS